MTAPEYEKVEARPFFSPKGLGPTPPYTTQKNRVLATQLHIVQQPNNLQCTFSLLFLPTQLFTCETASLSGIRAYVPGLHMHGGLTRCLSSYATPPNPKNGQNGKS